MLHEQAHKRANSTEVVEYGSQAQLYKYINLFFNYKLPYLKQYSVKSPSSQ